MSAVSARREFGEGPFARAVALVYTLLVVEVLLVVSTLAGSFLTRSPGGTLGTAGLLVVAAGVTALTSEAVLALLGSVLVRLWLRASGAMIRTVREEFTHPV